jgi:hypothetical protein
MLLNIVEKVSTVAPGYSHITSEAMAELREMNEGLRKESLKEKGLPITPAVVGDGTPALQGGPENPITNPQLEAYLVASKPVEADLTSPSAITKAAETPPTPVIDTASDTSTIERKI